MTTKFHKFSVFLVMSLFLVSYTSSKCVSNCVECNRGMCSKCAAGYGLDENECKECDRKNCLNCDNDTQDCLVCAKFHHRLSVEGGKYHECEKCGFGCQHCSNKEKCLKCAPMFTENIIERNECIVNHVKLFLILICILTGICFMSCLAFWCSPGPGIEDYLVYMRGKHHRSRPGTVVKTEAAEPINQAPEPKDEPKKNKNKPLNSKSKVADEEKNKKKAEPKKNPNEESDSSSNSSEDDESGSSSYESSEESKKDKK